MLSDRQDACWSLASSAVSSGLRTAWVTAGGDLGLSQCTQLQLHVLARQIRCAVCLAGHASVGVQDLRFSHGSIVERYLMLSRYNLPYVSRHWS